MHCIVKYYTLYMNERMLGINNKKKKVHINRIKRIFLYRLSVKALYNLIFNVFCFEVYRCVSDFQYRIYFRVSFWLKKCIILGNNIIYN